MPRRKYPSVFKHGGARKGVAYQRERVRVEMQLAAGGEGEFPLWAVAWQWGLRPRNLYFRPLRHRIPYVIGPKDGPPGRQVWIPKSSLPRIKAMIWKLPHVMKMSGCI